jgi:hypothetical protein
MLAAGAQSPDDHLGWHFLLGQRLQLLLEADRPTPEDFFGVRLVGLGQVRIGVGMLRWQVGQAPVQRARSVCSSRTTW